MSTAAAPPLGPELERRAAERRNSSQAWRAGPVASKPRCRSDARRTEPSPGLLAGGWAMPPVKFAVIEFQINRRKSRGQTAQNAECHEPAGTGLSRSFDALSSQVAPP